MYSWHLFRPNPILCGSGALFCGAPARDCFFLGSLQIHAAAPATLLYVWVTSLNVLESKLFVVPAIWSCNPLLQWHRACVFRGGLVEVFFERFRSTFTHHLLGPSCPLGLGFAEF